MANNQLDITSLFHDDDSSSNTDDDDDISIPAIEFEKFERHDVILPKWPFHEQQQQQQQQQEHEHNNGNDEQGKNESKIQIVQYETCFDGYGKDITGCVLWGASVHLSSWLLYELNRKKTAATATDNNNTSRPLVIELGCGCALPSLYAAKSGKARVIATDMSRSSLSQAKYNAHINQLTHDCDDYDGQQKIVDHKDERIGHLSFRRLVWDEVPDHTNNNNNDDDDDDIFPFFNKNERADYCVASDVIYSESCVDDLINVIKMVTKKPGGVVVVATRDGRRGVDYFKERIESDTASFCGLKEWKLPKPPSVGSEEEGVTGNGEGDDTYYLPSSAFEGNVAKERWMASHTIYVFDVKA